MAAFFAERARGGVGLIVTGGFAPNIEGWPSPSPARWPRSGGRARHREVTDAVHAEGGKIALQILHTGRYGYHPLARGAVAHPERRSRPSRRASCPSAASSDRSRLRALRGAGPRGRLRRRRGDGLSEGYLINQFLVTAHQPPQRRWGGSFANRMRLPVEIVRACARRWGRLHHHLPPVDARPGRGRQHLGRGRAAGARRSRRPAPTIINTGIGWHEARIPTIATSVPRAAFAWVTAR
jgi:2,4-dienoyl-CoA reductase (NADPH2)